MSGFQVFDIIVAVLAFMGWNASYFVQKWKERNGKMRNSKLKPYITSCAVIFCFSALIYIVFFVKWSNIHYYEEKSKATNVDSSKSNKPGSTTSPTKQNVDTAKNQPTIKVAVIKKHPNHTYNAKQKTDTLKKEVKEDNSVKVDRSPGSLIVGGKNNHVDINTDPPLTPELGAHVIKLIESERQRVGLLNRQVGLFYHTDDNGKTVYKQLLKYLPEHGYLIVEQGSGKLSEDIHGIKAIYSTGINGDKQLIDVEIGSL